MSVPARRASRKVVPESSARVLDALLSDLREEIITDAITASPVAEVESSTILRAYQSRFETESRTINRRRQFVARLGSAYMLAGLTLAVVLLVVQWDGSHVSTEGSLAATILAVSTIVVGAAVRRFAHSRNQRIGKILRKLGVLDPVGPPRQADLRTHFLKLWDDIENALLEISRTAHDDEFASVRPRGDVIRRLQHDGIVTPYIFDEIRSVLKMRNEIVHGRGISPTALRESIAEGQLLRTELRQLDAQVNRTGPRSTTSFV